MVNSQAGHSIQQFATLLRSEWGKLDPRQQTELDTEDLLDILWLARYLSVTPSPSPPPPSPPLPPPTPTSTPAAPAPASTPEPRAGVYMPPPVTDRPTESQPQLGGGLPLQVPAAHALRSQLDLARALRPLKRKIPSPTQRRLDEEATAIQIAQQGIWSPVLVPAPERWFDLAIVVEDSPSLKLWQDTIEELQTLVERQGAFRQIRTWRLTGKGGSELTLSPNWQTNPPQARSQSAKSLLDPTRRRLIWLVTDCTSDRWDSPAIYEWLRRWGKHSPLAIVQLFPERLWPRTALGIGQPIRLSAGTPGATHAILSAKATPVYPRFAEQEQESEARSQEPEGNTSESPDKPGAGRLASMILPVISLEPEPLARWAKVISGVGEASLIGLKLDLNDLTPVTDTASAANELTPEQRVRQFCATASITAQKLAGLMAAVPVSLPITHLIQKNLLPQSRQVHVAEVFMSGLLEAVPPPPDHSDRPTHYRFPEPVRLTLIDAVPISKTIKVMDIVSANISERLGLGTKSFAALIASLPNLEPDQQQTLQPFAEITLSTLRRLGGDYRAKADQLARYLTPSPPIPAPAGWPPLQEHAYRVAWVEVEPLQRFEFETATIAPPSQRQQRPTRKGKQPQPRGWVITRSAGAGWQRVEDLGSGVQLELVEILGGRFLMGSPQDEPERYDDEGPQHEVSLSDFFIGKYAVTQAQWRAVAALPRVNWALDPDPSRFKGENRPVEQVSWYDAIEFCARLSVRTGREYGLPTEAEWEYACRAGTTTPFHFGETITTDLANYNGTYTYNGGPEGIDRRKTTDVGRFPANAFGLYDMHGNVWEWCADHWHSSYADKPKRLKANGNLPWLSEDKNANRLLRGGSWFYYPRNCRSACRLSNHPGTRRSTHGFRVVCRAARTLQ